MKFKSVFHLISYILIFLAAALAFTWVISYIHGDPAVVQRGFARSFALLSVIGITIFAVTRHPPELSIRDGIGVVTFGWITASVACALPFMMSRTTPLFIDALFESVSGLTTTGASILPDPDSTAKGILFWRAITHFYGGMGILVFCVALLPLLGVGGMQLFRAETSSVSRDRLTPRIASTAKLLWGIYLGLNLVLTLLLWLGGMSWFDAICHALATNATGGFSTRTASIAAFHSVYIEVVIMAFMLLSAVNFTLHFRLIRGSIFEHFKDAECRFFLIWIFGIASLVTCDIWLHGNYEFLPALRAAFFATISLGTTTGYCTDDFDLWPTSSRLLLLFAMIVGGCAGSTAGGLKQVRLLVVLKRILRELLLFIYPRAVVQIKVGKHSVDQILVSNISVYFAIYLLSIAICTWIMSYYVDGLTACSSVVACMGGVGPGFGLAGGMETYAPFPAGAKLTLTVCMLLGRLEFFTLLVVLLPRFWKS